jgi:hypothetical protein
MTAATDQLNPREGYSHRGTGAIQPDAVAMQGNVVSLVNQTLGYDIMLALGAQRFALENFEAAEANLGVGAETWPEYEE